MSALAAAMTARSMSSTRDKAFTNDDGSVVVVVAATVSLAGALPVEGVAGALAAAADGAEAKGPNSLLSTSSLSEVRHRMLSPSAAVVAATAA
jgi:hypothetical protein